MHKIDPAQFDDLPEKARVTVLAINDLCKQLIDALNTQERPPSVVMAALLSVYANAVSHYHDEGRQANNLMQLSMQWVVADIARQSAATAAQPGAGNVH